MGISQTPPGSDQTIRSPSIAIASISARSPVSVVTSLGLPPVSGTVQISRSFMPFFLPKENQAMVLPSVVMVCGM